MLDSFIIQRILEEEQERRRQESRRPFAEVPVEGPRPALTDEHDGDRDRAPDRGVLIIDPDEA